VEHPQLRCAKDKNVLAKGKRGIMRALVKFFIENPAPVDLREPAPKAALDGESAQFQKLPVKRARL